MVVEAIVATKIDAIFPENQRRPALRIPEACQGRAGTRLQPATLKNSGGDHGNVADQVHLAEVDYREVLALAEYPRQLRTPAGTVTEEMQKADRADYESWLQGDQ
jgi:hypothetical protein